MKTLITTLCFDVNNLKNINNIYVRSCKVLIESYLKYTNFDILVLTNVPNSFKEYVSNSVTVVDYDDKFNEPITYRNKFNMHLKRLPLKLGSELDYDIIYFNDCDCFITGWDNKSYIELIKEEYDVIFPTRTNKLGSVKIQNPIYQKKIDSELGDLFCKEFDEAPMTAETFIIFKNNNKLKKFLEFWDKIVERSSNPFTYYCALYYGTSTINAGMNYTYVTEKNKFSTFGRIHHAGKYLNYYGIYI